MKFTTCASYSRWFFSHTGAKGDYAKPGFEETIGYHMGVVIKGSVY